MRTFVRLEGMILSLSIGIHDFERAARQRYLVDIVLEVDPAHVFIDTDDFAWVFDYDPLRQGLLAMAEERHWETQEFFASEVLRRHAARPGVRAARIHVRKPDVYEDAGSVGIEIAMSAEDLQGAHARSATNGG